MVIILEYHNLVYLKIFTNMLEVNNLVLNYFLYNFLRLKMLIINFKCMDLDLHIPTIIIILCLEVLFKKLY